MFAFIKSITALFLCISTLFSHFATPKTESPALPYTSIGQPLVSYFENSRCAHIPWDMLIFDSRLYVGCGDYDSNAGPVPVMYYDLTSEEWICMGELPDEQLNRFCVIDGNIVIPGTDPKDSWEFGNYYRIEENNTLKTIRNIPGGIHNYDMVKYNGLIFAGLGVEAGNIPISVSSDDGITFQSAVMYKEGTPVDTSAYSYVRCYDLITFKNTLYATLYMKSGENDENITYELYEYSPCQSAFIYKQDMASVMDRSRISYDRMRAKAEFDGRLFIASDKLYTTDDMTDFHTAEISLDEKFIVCDIYEYENRLFVLGGKTVGENTYKTICYEYKNGLFSELFSFDYEVPPISLACSQNEMYIGYGNAAKELDANGTILKVNYQ